MKFQGVDIGLAREPRKGGWIARTNNQITINYNQSRWNTKTSEKIDGDVQFPNFAVFKTAY